MNLIDTHCHLAHGRLQQAAADVLDRAAAAGVTAVVCAAGTLSESRAALGLSRRFGGVSFTAGVHPHDAKDAPGDYLRRLEDLAADARHVAVGEIGLDYHYDFSPRDAQRRVFAEQLALAARLGKPVVVHTREAFDDTIAILRASAVPGASVVFHSFTGDETQVRTALDLGATIGFSGIVTFRKADDLRAAAAVVPDDRILVETDAPYLSPEPVRRMKTNEPANVVHVACCLAALRHTTPARFAEIAAANAVAFFGLPADAARPAEP